MSPAFITFIPFKIGRSRKKSLLADAELGDDRAVTLDVLLRQIVQHTAALTNQLVHAQTAVVVVGVLLQVLGELTDTLGPNGDLDLGGPGVVLVGGVLADDGGLLFLGDQGFCSFLIVAIPCVEALGGKDTASAAYPTA